MPPDPSDRAVLLRRLKRHRWAFLRWYYHRRYGLGPGSMLPKLGSGKYVSVYQRGPFLDIHEERTGEIIRLVPYQPNHGVMVELWRDGRLVCRTHCDFERFRDVAGVLAEAMA